MQESEQLVFANTVYTTYLVLNKTITYLDKEEDDPVNRFSSKLAEFCTEFVEEISERLPERLVQNLT